MPPLSAIDAIGPAWQHTRRLLLGRRDPRLLFKLTALAFFAEVGGCNARLGSPGNMGSHMPPAIAAVLVAVAAAVVAVVFVLWLLFFYLGSRLQFVLFHSVLRSETRLAPLWRLYGAATWRWIGLKLAVIAITLLCAAPFVVPAMVLFFRTVGRSAQSGQPPSGAAIVPFLAAIFGFIGAVFLLLLLAGLALVLLRDFALPSMALEATPLREAVRRVIALLRFQPGPVAVFVLMRFLLGFAGGLVSLFAVAAMGFVLLLPLGGAGVALWLSLRHAAVTGHIVMVAGLVVLGAVLFVLVAIAFIVLAGAVRTFLQAYAIFFLAGRYPLLGSQLAMGYPPAPQGWTPAAVVQPSPTVPDVPLGSSMPPAT